MKNFKQADSSRDELTMNRASQLGTSISSTALAAWMQPLRACRPVVALHLKIPSAETRRKLLLPFAAAEGNRAPNREGLKSLSFASLLRYGAQSLVLVAPAPMNLRNAWPCSCRKQPPCSHSVRGKASDTTNQERTLQLCRQCNDDIHQAKKRNALICREAFH